MASHTSRYSGHRPRPTAQSPCGRTHRISPYPAADSARSKVAERVPVVRPSRRLYRSGIARKKAADRRLIPQRRGGEDVRAGHLRIARNNRVRLIQSSRRVRHAVARNQRGTKKRIHGIGQIGDRRRNPHLFDSLSELRPALEAMFARNHKLRIRQRHAALRRLRMMRPIRVSDRHRCRGRRAPVLWPASCIAQGWDGQGIAFQAYEAPFGVALRSACRAGKKFRQIGLRLRWARPFPRTGCALRAENNITSAALAVKTAEVSKSRRPDPPCSLKTPEDSPTRSNRRTVHS